MKRKMISSMMDGMRIRIIVCVTAAVLISAACILTQGNGIPDTVPGCTLCGTVSGCGLFLLSCLFDSLAGSYASCACVYGMEGCPCRSGVASAPSYHRDRKHGPAGMTE